jgi:phage baseplate assembly protein W
MMNRRTGRRIDLLDHIAQSVADIVTTPLGSRVMRRDYGCLLPLLLDQPDNAATQIRLTAAVAGALMRWEPRVRLTRLGIGRDPERPGYAELQLRGQIVAAPLRHPQPLTLNIPIRGAA